MVYFKHIGLHERDHLYRDTQLQASLVQTHSIANVLKCSPY